MNVLSFFVKVCFMYIQTSELICLVRVPLPLHDTTHDTAGARFARR